MVLGAFDQVLEHRMSGMSLPVRMPAIPLRGCDCFKLMVISRKIWGALLENDPKNVVVDTAWVVQNRVKTS
jgi:hypothetical protein